MSFSVQSLNQENTSSFPGLTLERLVVLSLGTDFLIAAQHIATAQVPLESLTEGQKWPALGCPCQSHLTPLPFLWVLIIVHFCPLERPISISCTDLKLYFFLFYLS